MGVGMAVQDFHTLPSRTTVAYHCVYQTIVNLIISEFLMEGSHIGKIESITSRW